MSIKAALLLSLSPPSSFESPTTWDLIQLASQLSLLIFFGISEKNHFTSFQKNHETT